MSGKVREKHLSLYDTFISMNKLLIRVLESIFKIMIGNVSERDDVLIFYLKSTIKLYARPQR